MGIPLKQIWAKTEPFQSVLTHGIVTGTISQELFCGMLTHGAREELSAALGCAEEFLESILAYIASLHDIGKIEAHFQASWPEMSAILRSYELLPELPGNVRHEKTTSRVLSRIWTQNNCTNKSISFYSKVLSAHHQGRSGLPGRLGGEEWNTLQDDFELYMRRVFLNSESVALPTPDREFKGAVGALFLGTVVLADWIASGNEFADAESWVQGEDSIPQIRLKARRFMEDSGLKNAVFNLGESFPEVWTEIPRNGMRDLQRETEAVLSDADERISAMLIEAPMGEGKTEAGVYAALTLAKTWGKSGLYVAMPTAATSNQMVERMRSLLKKHSMQEKVRLLHGTAWLTDNAASHIDSEESNFAASWLQPARRGMLGQFAVGTVDQVMLAVLMAKFSVLRLLGLSGKALVIDELHSYDVYMSEIITLLLRWCRALEIPVVMLSATLPPDKKSQVLSAFTDEQTPQAYPAITSVSENGKVTVRKIKSSAKSWRLKVDVLPALGAADTIAATTTANVSEGGCLCVLMNTIAAAQKVYLSIKASGFDGTLLLFHARFPVNRRTEIEQECIKLFGKDKSHRPQKAILVATQVVEQSLDVDFDGIYSAIAPIDLLLQRAGRIHRHECVSRPDKLSEPRLVVLTPEKSGAYGDNAFVYPECLLDSSLRLISERDHVNIPEDMPGLVAAGYDPSEADDGSISKWMEHLMDNEVKAASSIQYEISPPEKGYTPVNVPDDVLFDDTEDLSYLSVKTRLGEASMRIVLLPESKYSVVAARARKHGSGYLLSDVSCREARELMLASVAAGLRLLGEVPERECIDGRGILSGLRIYLADVDEKSRLYRSFNGGRRLILDDELGAVFVKEEKDELQL